MQCSKINQYIEQWKRRGYVDDIPDEVPMPLMRLNLAPSYKAIACAILSNDVAFKSLGFEGIPSDWYGALKKIEIRARNGGKNCTLDLF